MSTECECLQMTYEFRIYKRRVEHWYYDIPLFWNNNWPIKRDSIVIHGKSLADIQTKRMNIVKELEAKYSESTHYIRSSSE